MTQRTLFVVLLAALLLAGCSKEKPRDAKLAPDEPKPKPDKEVTKSDPSKTEKELPKSLAASEVFPAPYVESDPTVTQTAEKGVIRGRVLWSAPPLQPIASDQTVSLNGRSVRLDPAPPLRVDPTTRGVADVMVWLESVPTSVQSNGPFEASLTQTRGVYRPRAQFVGAGSTVTFKTTDDEADFSGSGRLRFTRQIRRGEQQRVLLPKPGLVTIRSNERPGIQEAYLRVVDHGYHAVTGTNGEFELPPLPPGKYDVFLWPAGMSRNGKHVRQRVVVSLGDGAGANVEWAMSSWER